VPTKTACPGQCKNKMFGCTFCFQGWSQCIMHNKFKFFFAFTTNYNFQHVCMHRCSKWLFSMGIWLMHPLQHRFDLDSLCSGHAKHCLSMFMDKCLQRSSLSLSMLFLHFSTHKYDSAWWSVCWVSGEAALLVGAMWWQCKWPCCVSPAASFIENRCGCWCALSLQ